MFSKDYGFFFKKKIKLNNNKNPKILKICLNYFQNRLK
jgi:hypothetical protein